MSDRALRPALLLAVAGCALVAAVAIGLLLLTSDDPAYAVPRAPQPVANDRPDIVLDAPATTDAADDAEDAVAEDAQPAPSAPTVHREDAVLRGRQGPLPKTAEGKVDFAALGLTGKESGAELLATNNDVRAAPLHVEWSVGDEWTVHSYYRQMQAGNGEVWSGPARWRYRVDRQELYAGQPALVFVVRLVDDRGAPDPRMPATTFYVSAADQSLLGADLYNVRGGKGKFTRVAYRADGPSVAAGSIVPFDLPTKGAMAKLSGGPALPRLEPVSAASQRNLPQRAQWLGAGEDYLELSFDSPTDGTRVLQRWAPGDRRWPAVTETPTRRSYRLN